ncbi:MAG: hypothetical protein SR1Q5_03085 [Quinella sp. 1Q5]|nr:hypothetical protein [Quinella sp. 1Q5]
MLFGELILRDKKICFRLSNLSEKRGSVGIASDGGRRTFQSEFANKFRTTAMSVISPRPLESSVSEVNRDAFAKEIFPHDADAFALFGVVEKSKLYIFDLRGRAPFMTNKRRIADDIVDIRSKSPHL